MRDTSSSGCVGAGDTKFIPNLKTEIYIIWDTNGFLNMDILYAAATLDIFIFVVAVIKKVRFDLWKNNGGSVRVTPRD